MIPPQIDTLFTHAEYKKYLITAKANSEDMRVSPVVQTTGSNQKKLIPGSTLKGAYRNKIEKYLIDLYSKNLGRVPEEARPCIPVPANSLSKEEKDLINNKHYYREGGCVFDEDDTDDSEKKEQKKTSICPACYFLGAQGLPGFVSVPCLYESTSKYGVFEGVMFVLMRDEHKNWEFGRARPYGVDLWINEKFTPEQYLQFYVINLLKSIQSLGSVKGSLRVEISVKRFSHS